MVTQMPHHKPIPCSNLAEGLESLDLENLVSADVTIDEYKSKMGDDESTVVLTFKVASKLPAQDLMSFIEKSYDWILDADVSSGELDDGSYLVFVEFERNSQIPKNLIDMFTDLVNLTGIELTSWTLTYHKPKAQIKLSQEAIAELIPLSAEDYLQKKRNAKQDLDKLKTSAGVEVRTKASKNPFTDNIKTAAGIL